MENKFLNSAGVAHLWKRIGENFVSKDGGNFAVGDSIVEGYYFDEKFYEDSNYEKEIVGNLEKLYIDIRYNKLYRYDADNTTYVLLTSPSDGSGSGEDGVGISHINYNSDTDCLTIYLTDGFSYDITGLKGVEGAQGIQGEKGLNGNLFHITNSTDAVFSSSSTRIEWEMSEYSGFDMSIVQKGDFILNSENQKLYNVYEVENNIITLDYLFNIQGKQGDRGATGGYYIPTISDDGVVSWTPTDEEMPSIDPVSVKGDRGSDGLSAYDIAKNNGFEGVEEEWLESLKGETGKRGTVFVPSISENGDLSWTNDDGLENPPTVNIASKQSVNTFDDFPTEEQIRALPNNSYFTIKGINTTYRKVNYFVPNGLIFINPDDENDKVYIFPIDQPEGEIYLPFYGVKTGSENAENNSAIMDKLTRQICSYGVSYGSIFKLPAGNFYFSRPIDLVNQPFGTNDNESHYSLKGEASTIHKNSKAGITFLHFPNLTEGQVALTVAQCSISDFVICGTSQQYHLLLDRTKLSEGKPDEVVQETINIKAYGIKANGGTLINNVGFKNFYYGCYCETSNMIISDISFHHCHYGLSIGHDIKVQNLFGFNVMTLLQMRGSVSSATNVRGDSIGKHLVELLGGHSNTLVDLDCDFGMDAIVAIGDGTSSSTLYNLSITGIHGRAAVRHSYKASDTPVTAEDITSDTVGEYGVITVKNGASLYGAVIITNQGVTQNPMDEASEYRIPFILLSAGAGTNVQGVQIFSTSYTSDELTEDWVKKRVSSLSTLAGACLVKIQTSVGSVTYKKDSGIVTVIDDATDIYERMDKSSLALSGEVVKSINGIYPDINGNIEVIEQEPIVVESPEECVDTSMKYVLPDGYIYVNKQIFVPGEDKPLFVNQLPNALNPLNTQEVLNDVGYKNGVMYEYDSNTKSIQEYTSHPVNGEDVSNRWSTGLIPVKNGDRVRLNNIGFHTTSGVPFCYILVEDPGGILYRGSFWFEDAEGYDNPMDKIVTSGGKYTLTGSHENGVLSDVEMVINGYLFWAVDWGTVKYIWFLGTGDSIRPEDVIITVNDEIEYENMPDRYESRWVNTGKKYIKTDYTETINSLEQRIKVLEETLNIQN